MDAIVLGLPYVSVVGMLWTITFVHGTSLSASAVLCVGASSPLIALIVFSSPGDVVGECDNLVAVVFVFRVART